MLLPPTQLAKTSRGKNPAASLAAATVMACATGAACAGVKVQPEEDEQRWLDNCPAESREVIRTLDIYTDEPFGEGSAWTQLLKEPNVIPHDAGCEVREGPVCVLGALSPAEAVGALCGTIREGSDRVFFRFTELKLRDGRSFPICAIAAESFKAFGPGIPKVTKEVIPASERNPGYIYITTGFLHIRLAPYIRK